MLWAFVRSFVRFITFIFIYFFSCLTIEKNYERHKKRNKKRKKCRGEECSVLSTFHSEYSFSFSSFYFSFLFMYSIINKIVSTRAGVEHVHVQYLVFLFIVSTICVRSYILLQCLHFIFARTTCRSVLTDRLSCDLFYLT